ncbi:hypothetical protein B0J17DRAFT_681796 [Rhizoctonia solani]|nr:hypothetical protein B0J17DRAFT_681796 [Rhizoctonia solani]
MKGGMCSDNFPLGFTSAMSLMHPLRSNGSAGKRKWRRECANFNIASSMDVVTCFGVYTTLPELGYCFHRSGDPHLFLGSDNCKVVTSNILANTPAPAIENQRFHLIEE